MMTRPPCCFATTPPLLVAPAGRRALPARRRAPVRPARRAPGRRRSTPAPCARATACRPSSASPRRTASRARSCARRCTSCESRGLVRSRQGSGVYRHRGAAGEALTLDLALIGSIDDVLRVREVRRALEAEPAALAAERATRAQVAALRKALRAIDRSAAESARRRRGGPRLPSPARRGGRQPALRPPARVPRAVHAGSDARHAAQRRDAAPTSSRRSASSTPRSSTPSPPAMRRWRGAAPSSTCAGGDRRMRTAEPIVALTRSTRR